MALVLPGYSKIIRAKSRNGDAFDSQRSQYQFCDAKYLGLMKSGWFGGKLDYQYARSRRLWV